MSEPQQISKKSKKKKKTNTLAPANSLEVKKNDAPKLETSITEVLPLKVGMTTKIKDVEVTMTNNGNGIVENGTAKKKKKKKKAKQASNLESSEPTPTEEENKNLLNFNENHIELINHPEISVTISNANVSQVAETPKDAGSVKEPAEKVEGNASSKKKKKKKKKKNSESNPTADTKAPEKADEDTHSTPTYVKLPAAGDNCVLLVSHESFSNGNKQTKVSSAPDEKSKSSTVVLKKTETLETVNSVSAPVLPPTIPNGNSVSIFPVYSNPNAEAVKSPEFNVTSSLGKISDAIKNEGLEASKNDNVSDAPSAGEETKTKAQLKAERRAKQEAQRAAKLAAKSAEGSTQPKSTNTSTVQEKNVSIADQQAPKKQKQMPTENVSTVKKSVKTSVEREVCRKVQIFSHLPQQQGLLSKQLTDNISKIPPAILELGAHYSKGTLCGSNARCVGFLGTVREVILDYVTPPGKTLSKDLECKLQLYLEYLNSCRPLSVSIVNAMKFLKHQINHIPEGTSDENAKESLSQSINDFVREEILLAKEAITISASAKIVDGDTILVFAYSSLVKDVLCKAHDQNKTFKVIVVDSRAKLEGLEMLRQLVKNGLQCSYISINAVSSVIKKVNKVIIGAHALLANGFVMSRLGCKILSLVSSTYSVPVLVCCETYKFWERALTDSIVHNELGNPDDLVLSTLERKDSLLKWHDMSTLQIYNLLYDVTPSDFVSVVITEKGLIPCTSVPVLLRVKHAGRSLQE